MKDIDPIIATAGMVIASIIAGVLSTPLTGIGIFISLFVISTIGDKIMGNLPNTHS